MIPDESQILSPVFKLLSSAKKFLLAMAKEYVTMGRKAKQLNQDTKVSTDVKLEPVENNYDQLFYDQTITVSGFCNLFDLPLIFHVRFYHFARVKLLNPPSKDSLQNITTFP